MLNIKFLNHFTRPVQYPSVKISATINGHSELEM